MRVFQIGHLTVMAYTSLIFNDFKLSIFEYPAREYYSQPSQKQAF